MEFHNPICFQLLILINCSACMSTEIFCGGSEHNLIANYNFHVFIILLFNEQNEKWYIQYASDNKMPQQNWK